MKKFQLDDPSFYTQTQHYVDHADSPLFDTYRGIDHIERDVLHSFPFIEGVSELDHQPSKLYVPFAYNGASFLNSNIKNIQINHLYPAIGVLYFVMRDYPDEFRQLVDGLYVNRDDFYSYRKELNKIVERVTDGKGRGARPGLCSKDEMLRIASLIYIVYQTSNAGVTERLEWDGGSNNFLNPWCGSKKRVYFDNTEFEHYVAKMQRLHVSAVSWEQFYFAFAGEADQDSLWYWNVPNPFQEQWFGANDVVSIFNKLPTLDKDGAYILMNFPKTSETVDMFESVLDFDEVKGRDMYINDQFVLFDNMMSGKKEYLTLANYYPDASENFKRFSEKEVAKLAGGM